MTIEEIERHIKLYKYQGKKIFSTSSFQTQSVALLHIISKIDNSIPIYFINTGFLFPETTKFKDYLQELFKLNVIDLKPIVPKILQKDNQGNLLFQTAPDYFGYFTKLKQ